jgi:ubiquinone/menaquinone biosynthesis C-methylase UbiE
MKRKLYTLSYDIDLLKETNNESIFTSQEHANLEEKQRRDVYKSRESLLRHYLPAARKRIASSQFLIDLIINNDYQNILSLGAGEGVKEYWLKMNLPEKSRVVSTDFDPFITNKAKEFFPEILVEQFDFVKGDIEAFQNKMNIEFDLAIFFGSSYVMDDEEFIRVFANLRKIGIKNIVDFQAGYIGLWSFFRTYLIPMTIRTSPTVRKILRKPALPSENYRGKFHGYERTRGELRKLYKKSGWKIQKDSFKDVSNKYIALLG